MARPKSPKKDAIERNPSIGSLFSALKFLEPVSSAEGNAQVTHCQLRNKQAVMFNGLMARGCLIDADTCANVHLQLLLSSLKRCKSEVQVTQLQNALCVQSGKYKAFVPTLPDDMFAPTVPSAAIAPCDDRLKKSLEICGRVAVESGKRLLECSVLARANSCVSTDGKVLFEHWHGIDMPPMVIPKISQVALCKIDKKLTGFGVEWNGQIVSSVTFWFEDSSWLRTQTYTEQFPDTDALFARNASANLWPIPEGLFEGLEAIAEFASTVIFDGKIIKTSDVENVGATYEIKGSMPKVQLSYDLLMMFAGLVNKADFSATEATALFQGEGFRGLLAKIGTK